MQDWNFQFMSFSDKQTSIRIKMTVGKKIDESKYPSSGKFYVRVQQIPSSAGRRDIREFFSGLHIESGAIHFHGRSAFVVFYTREDAAAAVQMSRRRLLSGMVMRVSNVKRHEMRRSQLESARRKLVMDPVMQSRTLPPAQTNLLHHGTSKRIRPSTVSREVAKIANKEFCPDEIESEAGPPVCRRTSAANASASSVRSKQKNLKTIKPTPVLSLKQFNLVYEQEVF